MRFPIHFLVLGVVVGSVAWGDSSDGSVQLEYFSVDVHPLVTGFQAANVVSDQPISRHAWYQMDTTPRITVPPGCEAYMLVSAQASNDYVGYRIVGVKPKGRAITGNLFMLRRDKENAQQSVLAKFSFDVDAQAETPADRHDFLLAKGRHFQRLWSEEMAGSAMFRHLATASLAEVGQTAKSTGPNWPLRRRRSADESIQLMAGGRAVSENLQLDRQLATTIEAGQQRSLANVRGITVREIDWSNRLKEEATQLDPLADSIPHDQHAMFLPSFRGLASIIDRGDELARPVVHWLEPQSRKTDVLSFYQRQLGLPLNALTRHVGQALIDEVALTGSDPYFRTGTDIALLMQSKQPQLLQQAITTQVTAEAAQHSDVKQVRHRFAGHDVLQWSTDDRHFCSLIAVTDNAVVVTNSLQQMMKVLDCSDRKRKALGSLDEYRFFRQRYPRRASQETALIVISDATIRRWCSPQWRIAASRRTRARATIAEMTMRHADALVSGTVGETRPLSTAGSMPGAGHMWLSTSGVRSDKYGTLQFQTPIAEMDMRLASHEEVKLYEDWRRRYERQWRNAFDPIALELTLDEGAVSADLSVIPLMIRTQYRTWLDWVGNARLKPGAGDHHKEALASLDVAVNLQSNYLLMARMFLAQHQGGANIDLLGWIDGSFSIYLDSDKDWMKRVAGQPPFELSNDELLREVPIGFYVPSKNNFRMTAFVVAARAMLDQFSPNLIRWENAKHKDLTYVIATVVEATAVGNAEDMPRLYYVTTAEGLTISLNENVIKRTIDRHLARKKKQQATADQPQNDDPPKTDDPVEGPQIAMQIKGKGLSVMGLTRYPNAQRRMSRLAWSNLPILNYLRHRYPDRDPLDVYRQLLGQQLTEPAGGRYRWDGRFQTYVSSHYGHHLAPKVGPNITAALGPNEQIKTTLSFQDGGLRATLKLNQ